MNKLPPLARTTQKGSAEQRLAMSREDIVRWLAQDARSPETSSALDSALQGASPLLSGLRTSAGAAVLLGSLAQAWARSSPPPTGQAGPSSALDVAVGLVRRHPKTCLVVAGLVGLALAGWAGQSDRKPPL